MPSVYAMWLPILGSTAFPDDLVLDGILTPSTLNAQASLRLFVDFVDHAVATIEKSTGVAYADLHAIADRARAYADGTIDAPTFHAALDTPALHALHGWFLAWSRAHYTARAQIAPDYHGARAAARGLAAKVEEVTQKERAEAHERRWQRRHAHSVLSALDAGTAWPSWRAPPQRKIAAR